MASNQISTSPYLLSDSNQASYRYNGEMPPEQALEEQALNRRQHIANLLLQQGLNGGNRGQMVGRFYVPASPVQGLADLAKVALGSYGTYQNDQAREALAEQTKQATARAVQDYIEKTRGTPERTLPEGTEGPVNPAIPATPESAKAAIAQAMAGRIPGLQTMAQMDYAQMNKPVQHVDLGDKIGLIKDGQLVGTIPKGTSPDTQANIGQKEKALTTVSAEKQAEIDAANARQKADLAQRAAQFSGVSGNTAATIAGENARYSQPSGSAQLQADTQKALHETPSGSALANINANAAIAQAAHTDKMTQFEQNKRADEAALQARKEQYAEQNRLATERMNDARTSQQERNDLQKTMAANAESIKRDQLAMQENHQRQNHELQKESLDIKRMLAESQKAKLSEKTTLSPTAQKELFEADDAVNASRNVVTSLNKALDINSKAFEGGTAASRSKILGYIPGKFEGENATVELNNIVTGQALEQLRAVFGGMPTEGERKILLEVQGSVNMKASQRKDIYERAIQMANRRLEQNMQKAKQLREGSFFTPSGGPSQVAPSAPAVQAPAESAPQYPTATGPGGKKLIFKDGSWQPAQ